MVIKMTNKNIIEYIRKNKNLCEEEDEGRYSLIYRCVLSCYMNYGITPHKTMKTLLKNNFIQKEAKDIVQQLLKKISEAQ